MTDQVKKSKDHESRIQKLEQMENRLKAAEDIAATAQADVKSFSASGSQPSSHRSPASIPYDQRTIARIGNLGWDTEADLIIARAKDVLQKAGVDDGQFRGLSAPRRKGSMAELVFMSAASLQAARVLVQSLQMSFPEGHGMVWLDARLERSETRPARLVHRAAEMMEDVEAKREDRLPIAKKTGGKYIELGGRKAGFSHNGKWVFTELAKQRYQQESLEMIKSYAEAE